MSKIIVLSRKKIQFYAILALVVVLAGAYIGWQKLDNGQQIESYRWDPGTIIVKKNTPVEMRITGVNGQSHPFVIEGLNITGTVHKGKTTVIRFTPKDAGIYPIVCQTHGDLKSGGPMVGYIFVQ
jgi:plastocyanin